MREVTIRSTGLTTFWSARNSDIEKIEKHLAQCGLSDFCPARRTVSQAAREVALRVVKEMGNLDHYQINTLKRAGGFECVRVVHGEKSNQYPQEFYFTLDGSNVAESGGRIYPTWRLQLLLNEEMQVADNNVISSSLVAVAKSLNRVCLRRNGGLYWIPDAGADKWREVTSEFEKCANLDVAIASLEFNPSSIKIICEKLRNEIEQEIQSCDNSLTDDADHTIKFFTNKLLWANSTAKRVNAIAEELGVNLSDLVQSVDNLKKRLSVMAAVSA
jgi:hypothetical protein